ncbi:MAG: hypothetical protein F4Y71_05175, partial [Acidobacteria bacterium]|nr:hypothetical protein [Acidobacteriota bacterium]
PETPDIDRTSRDIDRTSEPETPDIDRTSTDIDRSSNPETPDIDRTSRDIDRTSESATPDIDRTSPLSTGPRNPGRRKSTGPRRYRPEFAVIDRSWEFATPVIDRSSGPRRRSGVAPSARVSRSRAMPARGRRSKPWASHGEAAIRPLRACGSRAG